MGYTAVIAREIGETSNGFERAAVDGNRNIVEELWDNGLGQAYMATKLQIKKRGYPTTYLDGIHIEVYVTDSRVIIKCDKYDKGDARWTGGLSALALNAIEKGIGAVRSSGKSLIGHVRYEWLARIYYLQKTGFFSDNTLHLVYTDNEETENTVELIFKKDADMAAIANKIFHKAVAYRRAMTDKKKDELISFLNEYSGTAGCIPVNTNPKEMSCISFPQAYYAPFGSEFRPEGYVDADNPEPLSFESTESGLLPDNSESYNNEYDNKSDMSPAEPELQKECMITDAASGKEVSVNKDVYIMGRSPAKCDHVINSPTVSSTHARIIKLDFPIACCYYT